MTFYLGSLHERPWIAEGTQEIVGIPNGTGISARTGLVFVSIESTNVYTYWYQNDTGKLSDNNQTGIRSAIVIGDVQVFEEDRTDGTLIKFVKKCQRGRIASLFTICDPSQTAYEFYIPRGTVAINFHLE